MSEEKRSLCSQKPDKTYNPSHFCDGLGWRKVMVQYGRGERTHSNKMKKTDLLFTVSLSSSNIEPPSLPPVPP